VEGEKRWRKRRKRRKKEEKEERRKKEKENELWRVRSISKGLAILTILAVTIVELYLGIILVAKVDLKYGLGLTTALVFVFAVFLCYLSTLANPPSCGCMGLTAVFESNRHNAIFGLFRNCVILWLLNAGYAYYYKSCKSVTSELA